MDPVHLGRAFRQYFLDNDFSAPVLAANWACFAAAAVTVAGLAVAAEWMGRRAAAVLRLGDRLASFVLGFAVLGTAVLGFGLTGLLLSPPRALSVSLLGALVAARILTSPRGTFFPRRLGVLAREVSAGRTPLVLVPAALAALIAVAGLFNLEMSWDALTYHLRLPTFYLYSHRVFPVWHHYCSPFPALVEMAYTPCLMAGGDAAARLLNGLFGILLLGAAWRLARDCGAPAGTAALIAATCPAFLVLVDRAYIDLGFAVFGSLAIRHAALFGSRRRGGDLVAAALLAGAAMGTKYLGILLVPAVLAAAWPGLVAAGRRLSPGDRMVRVAGLGTAVIVPLGPWLVRNWLDTGNPVMPFLGRLFGTPSDLPGDMVPFFESASPLAALLTALPDRAAALLLDPGGVDGPLSPVILGLLPLALAFRPVRPGPHATDGSGTRALRRGLIAWLAGWFILAPNARFFLPALPVAAALATLGLSRWLERAPRAAGGALRVLVDSGMGAGAFYAACIQWVFFAPFSMVLGLEDAAAKLSMGLQPTPFGYYMVQEVNARVPRGGKVLFLCDFSTYYVERECVADFRFGRAKLTTLVESAPTAAGLAKRLRQKGIGWLLFTGPHASQFKDLPGYYDLGETGWREFRNFMATRTEVEWQTENYWLFRVTRTHPPYPLAAFPVYESLAFREADIALSDGRVAEALAAYTYPPPMLREVGSTCVRQADALLTIGRVGPAETAFRQALSLGCDNPRVHMGLAQIGLRQKRAADAVVEAEAALRQNPLSAYVAATLALAYDGNGRREDAQEMIRRAIKLSRHTPAYIEIAKSLGVKEP